MYTEVTEKTNGEDRGGWVLYDGECPVCIGLAQRFEGILKRHGFNLAPLQTPWVAEQLKLPASELLAEMRVLTGDGQIFGGADGLVCLAGTIWWAWPLYAIAQLPGMMRILRITYRWIAKRRHCLSGMCARPKTSQWPGWILLIALPTFALILRSQLAAWAFMWALAFAIYGGFKWLTWWKARVSGMCTDNIHSLGYLLLWPGMDALAFFNSEVQPHKPTFGAWVFAIGKIGFGALLFWGVARFIPNEYPLLIGWVGGVGLIFLLHFGIFHLLALVWQTLGISAQPLMCAPVLATTLSDFWGNRWNLGFRQLSHDLVFQPLREKLGAVGAGLATFFASGLIHESVISIPARAGYGLPTAYFLLQGLGVCLERSDVGKRLGLGDGLRGRLFTLLMTAGPAFLLFHPPFISRVMIPFMHAVGAL